MATIVIADDDASMQILMSQSLEMMGHQVLVAADGNNGVELVRSQAPDVFIADANMPGLDGPAAIATLRKEGIEIPAILVTAGGYHTNVGQLDSHTHFLAKPFSPPKLASFVANVIAGRA